MTGNTAQLIWRFAGKEDAAWIAEKAGVTEGRIRAVAHQLGVSLRVPVPIEAKVVNWWPCPEAELDQYTIWLNAIREANEGVITKTGVTRLAVRGEGQWALLGVPSLANAHARQHLLSIVQRGTTSIAAQLAMLVDEGKDTAEAEGLLRFARALEARLSDTDDTTQNVVERVLE